MKQTLIIVATTTIVTILYWIVAYNPFADAGYIKLPKDVMDKVQNVVKTYKEDTGHNWQCKIDGKSFSLEAVVMWKISNESGYGTKWLWAKYSNWGNIKLAQKQRLPKQQDRRCNPEKWITSDCTIHGDGWRYFKYSTVERGLYDVAEWSVRRKNGTCNITYASISLYVKWHLVPNDPGLKKYLKNMIEVATAYDNKQQIVIADNEETKYNQDLIHGKKPVELKKTETTTCRPLKNIKNQFIELQIDWKTRQFTISDKDKAFNCQHN